MRAALAALIVPILAAAAAAEVEVLAVESATGGIWREGRFSPIRLKARAPAGEHEVRARLQPGKVVVETLRSDGVNEATILLPMLPEAEPPHRMKTGWTRKTASMAKGRVARNSRWRTASISSAIDPTSAEGVFGVLGIRRPPTRSSPGRKFRGNDPLRAAGLRLRGSPSANDSARDANRAWCCSSCCSSRCSLPPRSRRS